MFVGPPDAPLQVVRVTYTGGTEPTPIRVDGEDLSTPELVLAPPTGGEAVVEVPVQVGNAVPGQQRPATVLAETTRKFTFTVQQRRHRRQQRPADEGRGLPDAANGVTADRPVSTAPLPCSPGNRFAHHSVGPAEQHQEISSVDGVVSGDLRFG